MDFLDPRRKKAHRRRLKLGYALMSIVVAIGTATLLYLAYGFDIDRKTGNLIQNGTVYVDSKPGGARVYLDDVLQKNRTDTRMNLPAGVYTIRLEADGYRPWERTFNLDGGEIERLVYPYLLPNQLETVDIAQYEVVPGLVMQSPDRRWLLVQRPAQTYQFDVYDLNDPDKSPVAIIVPPALLTKPGADASLSMVEWSSDNRHVLLRRDYEKNSEFIMLDREDPSSSINLNTLLGVKPAFISLRNQKHDQFYYLDAIPGTLRIADSKSRTISAPLVGDVNAYATYGDDIVLYVTEDVVETDRAEFRIFENDKSYTLKQVQKSDNYVLEVSRYDNRWYYVIGSAVENISWVYENPLSVLKSQANASLRVVPMKLDNPRFVSFSANTQFVGIQSGNILLTLDLEYDQQYRTELPHNIPLTQKIDWMDGYRWIFSVNQQSHIVDFDGSNPQTLVISRARSGPFFDHDYNNVFTFEESKFDGTKKALTRTIIDE